MVTKLRRGLALDSSQNGLDHSGVTSDRRFPDDDGCQSSSVSVLTWIAGQVKDKVNMVGIELLNEPFNLQPSQIGGFCEYSDSRREAPWMAARASVDEEQRLTTFGWGGRH